MRKFALIAIAVLICISVLAFSSCAAYGGSPMIWSDSPDSSQPPSSPSNEFGISENPEIDTSVQDNINFSVDMHTANYMLFKNMLLGESAHTLRRQDLASIAQADQMLNYFDYDYSQPEGDAPLALTASVFDSPFNSNSKLLTIGLKAREIKLEATANNIVVLLDVSGSMSSDTKLGMAKRAILTMVENLSPEDKISLVTYASGSRTIFSGISPSDYEYIERAVNSLSASGSTNGEGGLNNAYSIAQDYYITKGNNRIILMSDGDFNVGISSQKELTDYISEQRDKGIYLSCIGFGEAYNYSLKTMEALAKHGNGNWGYIHNEEDIRKLLVTGLDSTLLTIAKDVKANIGFNSNIVDTFRLIGYESNILDDEEYEDDTTDAGEIGSGFSLTICFELHIKPEADLSVNTENFGQVNLKYKNPDDDVNAPSKELTLPVEASCYKTTLSDTDVFVSSVVEFALIAIESEYKADASLDNVISSLESLNLTDKYKLEFLQVVKTYKDIFFS